MMATERHHEGHSGATTGVPDANSSAWPETRSSGHPTELLLAALGKDRFTSQTFADHERATRRPTIRHGPWQAQKRHLEDDNRAGMGAFMTVNHTDLQGRTAANITEVAAYFADFDGAALPATWPRPPTAIVESSPGRYHVYWRVLNAPLTLFSHVQKHLSVLFGSDPKVTDLPRVMRLPGLWHAKGAPFLSRLVELEPANAFEHAEMVDAFGVPPVETITRTASRAPTGSGRLRRYVWSAVQGEHDAVAAAPEGTRNSTLHAAAVRLGSLVGAGVLANHRQLDLLQVATHASPASSWRGLRRP